MNIGAEDKKKIAVAGVMGVLLIGAAAYAWNSVYGGPSTPLPQAAAVATPSAAVAVTSPAAVPAGGVPGVRLVGGGSAVKVATTNGQLDPTLHMSGMLAAESLVYTGTGRNIFAAGPAQAPPPVKMEQAKFIARPGPMLPQQVAATGPPPPPPINLKFFGTATQQGVRRALLLSGDDVFLASPGDIVQRRYKIVSIAANSITVEDMPNSNKQSLPLVAN